MYQPYSNDPDFPHQNYYDCSGSNIREVDISVVPPPDRKAKSRKAARSRRVSENEEFYVLAAALPVSRAIIPQLDKASIMRLAISYIRLRKLINSTTSIETLVKPTDYNLTNINSWAHRYFETHLGQKLLETFDGFVFCLSPDNRYSYVSETVSVDLGLSQIDMLGNHFSRYLHTEDLSKIDAILKRSIQPTTFGCRMKSNLGKRQIRDSRVISVGYRVVEFTLSPLETEFEGQQRSKGFYGVGLPLPASVAQDFKLDNYSFVWTVSLDLKIHYSDPQCDWLFNEPLQGKSVYSLIHTNDVEKFAKFHIDIMELSGSTSCYYRLHLAKNHYVWVVSYGLKLSRSKPQNKAQMIALINFYIG